MAARQSLPNATAVLALGICSIVYTTGCSGSSNNKTEPSPGLAKDEKTELPPVLARNEKVREYFETLSKTIDEYISMNEQIIIQGKKSEAKKAKGDSTGFADAMNMLQTVTNSTIKMAPLLEKMEKLEKETDIMKNEMTSEEFEEFMEVYGKMMTRYYEMAQRLDAAK